MRTLGFVAVTLAVERIGRRNRVGMRFRPHRIDSADVARELVVVGDAVDVDDRAHEQHHDDDRRQRDPGQQANAAGGSTRLA